MGTIPDDVGRFIDASPVGVIATIRPDGSLRQSLTFHLREGDTILISTESKRGKAKDVIRTGRASYCVVGHERPYPCVTVEGRAEILTESIGAPTARIMARITGSDPGPPLTDEALAAADRVVLRIAVEHTYGASYLPAK
ncbi:MAG: hypothetical protein DYH08_09770 [Actinobacteria bacterium ATB1]|nr:hypothetical protein [Actinobacteria bacterium ATB1]